MARWPDAHSRRKSRSSAPVPVAWGCLCLAEELSQSNLARLYYLYGDCCHACLSVEGHQALGCTEINSFQSVFSLDRLDTDTHSARQTSPFSLFTAFPALLSPPPLLPPRHSATASGSRYSPRLAIFASASSLASIVSPLAHWGCNRN